MTARRSGATAARNVGALHRKLAGPALLTLLAFTLFYFSTGAASEAAASPGARFLSYVSGGIGWLALAWLGSRTIDFCLYRAAAATGSAQPPRLLGDLLRAGLFAFAVIAILVFVFEQQATGLIATSSVAIAVIGFALRYIISDVFSGIALNFDHPYRIGDWVEPAGSAIGRVTEITWRTTRLVTREGTTVIVPNGLVSAGRLVNYSEPGPAFRASLRLWIDPELPVERVKKVLLAGAFVAQRSYPGLDPDVLAQECGEAGILYAVRFRVADAGEENVCRDAVIVAVTEALRQHGIGLAAPRREVSRRPAEASRAALAPPSREALIERCGLFAVFTAEERAELAELFAEVRVKRRDAVFRRGAPGGSLFLVADGALEVLALAPDGSEVTIDRMVPGDVFGEISLLTGETRSATILAITDALLYELGKEALEPFLWRRMELFDALAALMVERQKQNRARLATLAANAGAAAEETDLASRFRSFFGLSRR